MAPNRGDILYGIDTGAGTLYAVNVATGKVGPTIQIVPKGRTEYLGAVAVLPDGREALVTNFTEGTLVPVDLVNGAVGVLATISLPVDAEAVSLDPDGGMAYVVGTSVDIRFGG